MQNPHPVLQAKKHQHFNQLATKAVALGFRRIELVEFKIIFGIYEAARIFYMVKQILLCTSGNRWA